MSTENKSIKKKGSKKRLWREKVKIEETTKEQVIIPGSYSTLNELIDGCTIMIT